MLLNSVAQTGQQGRGGAQTKTAGTFLDFNPDGGGRGSRPRLQAIAEKIEGEELFMMAVGEATWRPQTFSLRDLAPRAPSSRVLAPLLCPCLLSLQELTVFLCLPGGSGFAVSGHCSVHGSFLAPHPADAWAGL